MTTPKLPLGRPPSDDPSKVYAVRLRRSQIARLRALAESRKTGVSTLVREWVDERLTQEKA